MGTSSHDSYERLVDSIYAAAFDDSEWCGFVAMLETELGIDGTHLLLADAVGPDPRLVLSRLYMHGKPAPDIEERYLNDYFGQDERVPRVSGLPVGKPVHNRQIYTPVERRRTSATWNEFLHPLGGTNQLVVRLSAERHDVWTVTRGSQDEYGSEETETIGRLALHLGRLANVRRSLSRAEILGAALTEVLDRSSDGVLLLDGRGRIVHANRRSRELLDVTVNGVVSDAVATSRTAVARAVREASPAVSPPCASVVRARNGAGEWLTMNFCPTGGAVPQEVAVLVLVSRADRLPARAAPEAVAEALGLTRAEAEVAVHLAEGRTVREIAELRRRTPESVRWHLKQAYAKTGTHRQAALVRVVLAVAVG